MFTTLNNGQPGIRSAIQVNVVAPPIRTQAQSPEDHAPILDFIASDESLDRFDEIICASGWHLEAYRRNPVFQNAHQYGDILFTLGKALITEVRSVSHSTLNSQPSTVRSTVLYQRIQFATDVNPAARIAYGLYKGKFLNAVSVGFIPLRWQDGPKSPGSGRSGGGCRRKYLEQELLEVSAVGIPANPNALALGLKSGAIEKGDLREVLALLKSLAPPAKGRADSLLPAAARQGWPALPSILSLARELRGILRRA